jgi:hypothetical protein
MAFYSAIADFRFLLTLAHVVYRDLLIRNSPTPFFVVVADLPELHLVPKFCGTPQVSKQRK